MFIRGLFLRYLSAWPYPVSILALFWVLPKQSYPALFCVLAVLSLLASLLFFRRFRTVHDTVVASLKAVAQGYVSLSVKAMPAPGDIGAGPHDLPPLVWFSNGRTTSKNHFLLEDEFGNCHIDPHQAEIITPIHQRFQKTFRGIFPGETVYVLGQLSSTNPHQTDAQKRTATLDLLALWKQDQAGLLARFDKNQDGKIDEQELMLAKKSAKKVIESDLDYTYQQPNTHLIEKPDDFRPLIISSIPLDTLVQTYYRACLLHLLAWPTFSVLALVT